MIKPWMYVIFNKIIQSHCRLRSLACSYEFYYADICRVRIHTYYISDLKKTSITNVITTIFRSDNWS